MKAVIAIRKGLILKLFDAAYMQRWNDHLRPFDLIELDKQGHKMVVAYFIGKHEEGREGFDWIQVIEGAIFDLLQRIVITDIKPPVFYRIKQDEEKYKRLNSFVLAELDTVISSMGSDFKGRFESHLAGNISKASADVLEAAHSYASYWEFGIIERMNPDAFELEHIRDDFVRKIESYRFLEGMRLILDDKKSRSFIDICGRLRYQNRWAQLHRIPRTSVLAHSAYVAMLSYIFSLEMGACPRRCVNNFFTGLFHDLPEVFTRDIISPVKRSIEGLEELIKDIERENMEKVIYPLLPKAHCEDIQRFTQDEFDDEIVFDAKRIGKTIGEIDREFNLDIYSPRDGKAVRAADRLAAFIEAYSAIQNGCVSMDFRKAALSIRSEYENTKLGRLDLGSLYADF
ncbi:YfbR-like 5'-deoxynucleotidase [Peptoclostridium acidaminophilum]|nr:YfbR-like 5'-deoxynucleotidase [Peptoclostridium acidaminophilum]